MANQIAMTTSAPDLPNTSYWPAVSIPQLPPAPPPPSLSTDGERFSLEPILRVLKNEWVWEFFFAPEFDIHEQLEHTVNQTTFTAVEYTLRLANRFPVNAETTIFNKHGNLLILPSFSTGNITVGFAVDEVFKTSTPSLQPPLTLFRAARDDVNSCYISISEDPVGGTVYFNCLRLISPAHREYYNLTFDYERFHSALKSVRAGHFDEGAFRQAMVKSLYNSESRVCPSCYNAPSAYRCNCKLSTRRKRHPMDVASENINLSLYLGHYSGTGDISSYVSMSPFPKSTSRFAITHSTLLAQEFGVKERLSEWALLQSAQMRSPLLPPYPPKNLVAAADTDQTVYQITEIASRVLEQQKDDETSRTRTKVSGNMPSRNIGFSRTEKGYNGDDLSHYKKKTMVADSFPTRSTTTNGIELDDSETLFRSGYIDDQFKIDNNNDVLSLFDEDHMTPMTEMSPMIRELQTPTDHFAPSQPTMTEQVRTENDLENNGATVLPTLIEQPLTIPSPSACAEKAVAGQKLQPRRTDCCVPSQPTMTEHIMTENELENNETMGPSNPIEQPPSIPPSSANVERPLAVQKILPRRQEPVAIAPALPVMISRPCPTPLDLFAGDERRRREEQRRIQNRIAAHRSNSKRKEAMQRLQKEMEEAETHKTKLLEKQKLLREENITLRIALGR